MIYAEVSAEFDAPASTIYKILADFTHHEAVLPKPPFTYLKIVEGGIGEGTVIEVQTKALGQTNTVVSRVTEPEPGRVLEEREIDGPTVTRFVVDALSENRSRLTISTSMEPSRGGLLGRIEAAVLPYAIRSAISKEMDLIRAYYPQI